jgi:PIN domain nuclease of toxin-antitoxin system
MGGKQLKYLLDTHIWIWWNTNIQKLSIEIKNIIANPDNYEEILLSAISIWEFCKLLEKGKLGISIDPLDWINMALDITGLRLVPVSPVIAYKSTTLPQPFHTDPADQIIVATAREENATILTKDQNILGYKQVRSLW